MKICFEMGFTLDEGYTIMKLSSKKKIDKLKKYEDEFMDFADEKGMDEFTAKRIFKMIVDSGLYSFNESHAIAYAILCYITAYLKTYYPREFMIASLTNAYEKKEKVDDLIAECRRLGFKFSPVDINTSEWDFSIENDNEIKIGFCAVKSFGENAYYEIESKRPFTSMEDFLDRIVKQDCSKRAIVPAIFSGAFNEFYDRRIDAYEDFCKISKCDMEDSIYVQGLKERPSINSTDAEFEDIFFGAELLSDPVNSFNAIGVDNIQPNHSFNIKGINVKIKKHKDKTGKQMAFITISTGDGLLEAVVFNSIYKNVLKYLKKNLICEFNLKKTYDGSFIVNDMEASAA